ncbi:MAG: PAAR-like domain-containing protein, partial [Pseudomonadota bacterium]
GMAAPYSKWVLHLVLENAVFIAGQEVAIEDTSYFSTSTGNEPATPGFRKGIKTSVIKGKAYFTQWSFDVVFEGFGVPRHQDMVGHNHGSMPSNTPLFPYVSRATRSSCKKEEERIERACKPEKEQSEAHTSLKKKSPLMMELKKKRTPRPKHTGRGKEPPPHWTEDHCDGLTINLGGDPQKAIDYIKDMKNIYQKMPGELQVLEAIKGELQDMVTKAGAKAFAKWGGRVAGKQLLGTSVPLWGNAVMGLVSVVDGAMAIGDVNNIRHAAIDALETLEILKKQGQELHDLANRFKNFDPENAAKDAMKIGAEGQDVLAELNSCTRARKCNLVPKSKKDGAKNTETADGKGCCPGQTGHHLIYDAMIKDSNCTGYEYGTAPTVCTEGGSQNHGSHGRVHSKMDEQVQELVNSNKAANGTMSMDEAITAAVKSHSEAFPASRCKANCIRAQLEQYYKSKCPNARLKAVNKNGGDVIPDQRAPNSI